MAKIFVTYTDDRGIERQEDFLDAGEAYDRADWLAESTDADPELAIEYHDECQDGTEFVLLNISFDANGENGLSRAVTGHIHGQGWTTREALIDLLDKANNIEKQYALSIAKHKRWFNDRRQAYYEIVGVVRSCEAATWELLYKREGDTNEFFRRPAWEWLELNRDGNPRFTKANECTDDFCPMIFAKPGA